MRLKGNGAPRLGNPNQRGDHYVTVKVEIPKDLSKEEEELIEKLKNIQAAKNGKEDKKGGWFGKGE
jgi:molecular chaperone DnaJ